jgi:cytochrome P450
VSKVFPVSVFMELMGMDLSRLAEMRDLAEEFFWNNNDSARIADVSGRILAMLGALVAEKRERPDDRLLSHFIEVDIDGRKMSDDEILAMSFVLFLGGMDTVTNVTGFAFQQLAQMPELQARLAANPQDIPAFADEAVRMFGVVNTPRLVIADIDIGPARFREGEMVLNVLTLGSRDPARIENPNLLDIDRRKIAHLTFSSGPHLCVGHVLGRTELRILTEEWFKRIPRFSLSDAQEHKFRLGTVMALENLPLRIADPIS